MKEIGLEELKVLQLDVLQAIHDFCQANGITYSLACGTALGAVRHHGYIPWDDDIDIYLLRDDYNRLIETYPIDGRYQLISMERDSNWDRPYAKAYDSKTVLIEENIKGDKTLGVGMDVYPIDRVPDNEIEWKTFDKRRRHIQRLLQLKQQKRFKGEHALYKNLVLFGGKLLLSPFSRKVFAKYIDRFIRQFNNTESPWVFESVQGMIQKNRFHRYVFNETIPVPFEDRQFMLFKDYDEYLSNGYGDYMKLPPKEKQVAHHSFKAYWL